MRVLIGHDGSSYADAAVDDLQWAGLPADVEALVVTVGEEPTVAPLASHDIIEKAFVGERVISIVEHANKQVAETLQEAMTVALTASSRLKSYFSSWQVQTEALTGKPATELIRRAREWGADLIVVGSQGRSALGRLILGSVSMEVAAGAHCSVRIGRRRRERTELKLLVAFDKSLEAIDALRLTLQRVWPPETELRVVGTGVDVGPTGTLQLFSTLNLEIEREAQPDREFELLFVGEPKISAGVVKGRTERVLMAEAQKWQADCIVIGSPSEHQVRELAANTECSLEIVRLPINR
jgi:nucleotide-binding universal stress UspA family protein